MRLVWTPEAWADYESWAVGRRADKQVIRRIHELIRDIRRDDPFTGIGKPEPLLGLLSGSWSRRVDQEHRLVYQVDGQDLIIVACRGHY